MTTPLQNQINEHLAQLSPTQQQDVLQFVKGIRCEKTPEERKRALLSLAGSIPPDDIAIMKRVIEAEFGQVDPYEW